MTTYDPAEQSYIMEAFVALLSGPTQDGGRKRELGTKVPWTEDTGHEEAMYRHLVRFESGETEDEDSGADPLVHVAWRALALAMQRRHIGQIGWLDENMQPVRRTEAAGRIQPPGGVP